jgi:hypothetical protein
LYLLAAFAVLVAVHWFNIQRDRARSTA